MFQPRNTLIGNAAPDNSPRGGKTAVSKPKAAPFGTAVVTPNRR